MYLNTQKAAEQAEVLDWELVTELSYEPGYIVIVFPCENHVIYM